LCGGGQEDGSPGEKGDERCTGGGIRGFGKRELEGEKLCKIAQYLEIKNSEKRLEPTKIGRELGLKGTESGRFKPSSLPCFCSL